MPERNTNKTPTLRGAVTAGANVQPRFQLIDLAVALGVMIGLFGIRWGGED